MEKDWKKVHSTASLQEAELLKAKLESEDILCLIMNKKDQSYSSFGDIDLYVHEDLFDQATIITEDFFKE
ncbi:MAG: putative signal transducing protein [Bacteroidia bacterium]|jgi:hypothetical protein